MIQNRLGNKRRLASKIITYIPNHTLYIELFFGAGWRFFNKKPIAPHKILNDLDDDVYNLWTVLQANHNELKEAIERSGALRRQGFKARKFKYSTMFNSSTNVQ